MASAPAPGTMAARLVAGCEAKRWCLRIPSAILEPATQPGSVLPMPARRERATFQEISKLLRDFGRPGPPWCLPARRAGLAALTHRDPDPGTAREDGNKLIQQKGTLAMKNRNSLGIASVLVATVAMVAGTGDAGAAGTPHQACAAARINAAAKYESCQAKAEAKFETAPDFDKLRAAASKCRVKYAGVWTKLQTKFAGSGTPCDQSRFTDNGTTVTDNLTGLQWEKKTDDSSIHDKDNDYAFTWAGDLDLANADGDAFDDFVFNVAGSCFATHCDWRLPTRAELQTIVSESYPCATSPCIAATFGPTISAFHITSSKVASDFLGQGTWVVSFLDGGLTQMTTTSNLPARAVRGGF